MLLRPHPMIPDNSPIDERHDDILVHEALVRLQRFDFVDIVENPRLHANFARWIRAPVVDCRLNKTCVVGRFEQPLRQELTPEVFDLLRSRTRLDARLWEFVARNRLVGNERFSLRVKSFRRSINNYERLMAEAAV
jgi:hypothetical protein